MTTLEDLLAAHGGGTGLAAAVRAGTVGAAAPTAAARGQIVRRDHDLHAFTQLTSRVAETARGPLSGLPLAVKDNIDVAGTVTSLGRPLTERTLAQTDAPAVAALVGAGAVVIGKTNLPEFATSAITSNATFGDAINPWAPSRTPGGSSGGSAVAVAAGMAVAALATDTAGSAVIPAALTSVWGLRPSHGAIALNGVAPLSPSLDTVGLIAVDALTLAVHHAVLTSGKTHPKHEALDHTGDHLDGLRIALLTGWFADTDPGIAATTVEFAARLAAHGGRLHQAELRGAEHAFSQARVIYATETAASIARIDPPNAQRRQGTQPTQYAASVERRRTARHSTSAVAAARNARAPWQREIQSLFTDADVLLCPVTPMTAPSRDAGEEAVSRLVRLTYPFCFAGQPLVSIPAGWPAGLPAGAMLVGPSNSDRALLRIAATIQAVGASVSATPPTSPREHP
jgi:aspartyl-tRNA(Asn)/glutamyl-tRNA(Gln) amidotransferase subunit A